jgi:hypothetical protein
MSHDLIANPLLRLGRDASFRTRILRAGENDTRWQAHLPADWRDLAEPPWEFRQYRDETLAAVRVVGVDMEGQPCYVAYRVDFIEPRSDDDEVFYAVVTYGEELAAWRLRDERWLIWREIRTEENQEDARSFYSLAQEMPR